MSYQYLGDYHDYEDELTQYGVLGMRWGKVRSRKELDIARKQRARNEIRSEKHAAKKEKNEPNVARTKQEYTKAKAKEKAAEYAAAKSFTKKGREKAFQKAEKLRIKTAKVESKYNKAQSKSAYHDSKILKYNTKNKKLNSVISKGETFLKEQGL